MLTFVGEGYSPAFTENYRRIARCLSAGEEIEHVSGPDDICAPLMEGADPHCLKASVIDRDAAAAEAVAHLLGSKIEPGSTINSDARLLSNLRRNSPPAISGKPAADANGKASAPASPLRAIRERSSTEVSHRQERASETGARLHR
jgi:hypothetical protein